MPTSSDDARGQRRAAVAQAVRQYLDGDMTYEELKAGFYDDNDIDIDDMFYVIIHEPSRRGLFGGSADGYAVWRAEVMEFVRKLKTS